MAHAPRSAQTIRNSADSKSVKVAKLGANPWLYASAQMIETIHCLKKWGTHIIPHNSSKCGPILIILSL